MPYGSASYMESCRNVVDVSVVVGGALRVVSALYPPVIVVSGFRIAVSEGETLPVSGGAFPTPLFSFWWLQAAKAAAAASVISNRIAKSLVRGFEVWSFP
ncbi:MAG TPA: hypothetical protein VN719_02145 [Gemmatimonadales bacterium]|jgi:hypothetical protein|nr:hypothetical protein [Gemmatimonadales bacterium]